MKISIQLKIFVVCLLAIANGSGFLELKGAEETAVGSAVPTNAVAGRLNAIPGALGIPKPGPMNDAPYAPQPILQGGVVLTLYPAGSPFLK